MKKIKQTVFCLVLLISLVSCSDEIDCKKDNAEFFQFYESSNVVAKLKKIYHGSYGITYHLGICENDFLVEQIALRGDT